MTDSSPLPKFASPPVVETILGVHFQTLEKLTCAHLGLLWDRCFRRCCPNVEERPPVEEVREVFGEELKAVSGLRWKVSDRPAPARLWMASADGSHIVQIQRDAIFANWQKSAEETVYRSFEQRRAGFLTDLEQVDVFLQEAEIGRVAPTSCVVTYINHLECNAPSQLPALLTQTFPFWKYEAAESWLPAADKFNLQLAFPMPGQRGRLNVHITPAVRRKDGQYLVQVELTARGEPVEETLASAVDWIDLGHEWVVRGFTSLTSPESQRIWGRIQ